jgi:hypothetical protein
MDATSAVDGVGNNLQKNAASQYVGGRQLRMGAVHSMAGVLKKAQRPNTAAAAAGSEYGGGASDDGRMQ